MLTIKKRLWPRAFFFVGAFVIAQGAACTPSGPRSLLKGERLIREGKYVDAADKLETAVRELPQNAQAWNHLGLAYHYAGSYKKAGQSYQQALQRDRNLASARYNLGSLELEQGNFPAAIDSLTTYVSLQNQSVGGWLKLATAQLRLGMTTTGAEKNRQLEGARRSFENVLRLAASPEAYNGLGIILIQRNKPREAAAQFSAAIQQRPGYAPAILNLAILHHQALNDRRLALQEYNDYLALNPRSDYTKEVQSIARQLDAELNPPARVAITNSLPLSAPTILAITNAVPRSIPTNIARTEPIPSRISQQVARSFPPPPTSAVVSPISPPAILKEPSTSVSRLPQESEFKMARDLPRTETSHMASAAISNASSFLTEPEPRPAKSAERPGLLQRMNPANWFGRKNKQPMEQGRIIVPQVPIETNVPVSSAKVPVLAAATPLPPKAPVLHYRYRSPAKPVGGNRRTAEPLFTQGVQQQRDGKLGEAMDAYRKAAQADPGFFEAYYNLGLAAYDAAELSTSLVAYEFALSLKSDSRNARYNFALALQKGNYPQEAANEFEKVLADHPEDTRAHLSLANLYAQQLLQPALARQHYLKVLETDPRHPQATAIRYWLAANP